MTRNDDGLAGCLGCFVLPALIMGGLDLVAWLSGQFPVAFAGTVIGAVVAFIIWANVSEARQRTADPPPPPLPNPPAPDFRRPSPPTPLITAEVSIPSWIQSPCADEARGRRESGIRLLSGPSLDVDVPRCLVCRVALSDDVIHCWRCRTPHHRACFRYAGACAVYACKCRRYRRSA